MRNCPAAKAPWRATSRMRTCSTCIVGVSILALRFPGGYLAAILKTELHNSQVHYKRFPHHLTHAANACYTSPFEDAACAIADGQGEFGSITYYEYKAGTLRELHRVKVR